MLHRFNPMQKQAPSIARKCLYCAVKTKRFNCGMKRKKTIRGSVLLNREAVCGLAAGGQGGIRSICMPD
jgi:hypothetical protein